MEHIIETSIENGIGRIILNDSDKKNALSIPMATRLNEALQSMRYDSSVRVVILQGSSNCFCAGGDLRAMKRRVDAYQNQEPPETNTFANMERLNQLVLTIRQMEKPVISMIDGACAGGGVSLAVASDFSIISETCKCTCAFVKIGLAPDMGSSLMISRRIGSARASELFLLGNRFSGKYAAEIGLFTKAVPSEDLSKEVDELAGYLASGPTLAYAEIKSGINRSLYSDLYEAMAAEAKCADKLTHTADHREAVTAFLEKRTPKFEGK